MNAGLSFTVRRATSRDAEGILECLHTAFQPFRGDYADSAFEDTVLTRDTVHQRLASMVVFVATAGDGEIVGTVACKVMDGGEGHLRGMAVHPSWQGGGVAQQLLEAVECALREKKCSRIRLDTTVPLKRAVRFYERNGFRPTGIVADFFGMPLFEYVKPVG
jgi:ribosomal protein S18 acetylase RimI-like enzyme